MRGLAPTRPAAGRTGVTIAISSRAASNTTMTVGRMSSASGTPIGSGLAGAQALHPPHHVVAEIAEHARRHRRQARRQLDARFGEQRPQRLERIAGAGDEGVRVVQRAPVDLGPLAGRAEDEVRVEPDHRIASALGAALDRLEEEHVAGASARELEIGRDRRLEIGDQRRHRDRGAARLVGAREGLVVGHHRHRVQPPSADCRTFVVHGDAERAAQRGDVLVEQAVARRAVQFLGHRLDPRGRRSRPAASCRR